MKLQLDTGLKTIKLEKTVKLKKLIEMLEKLLPNGLWKEFKLKTNTEITNWSTPIIIREREPYYWYKNPWWNVPQYYSSGGNTLEGIPQTTITNGASVSSENLNSGTYNIVC